MRRAVLRIFLGSLLLGACFPAGSVSAAAFRVGLPLPAGGAGQWRTLGEAGRPLFLALTDGLLGFDPSTGFVKPGLAQSWTSENEGRTWTFVLKAAKWSDGSAVQAIDFVNAWKLSGVKAATTAEDPRHFRVDFAQAVADVSVFTRPEYLLWPEAGARGCGPFLLQSSSSGGLIAVKNKSFREAAAIKVDRLEFLFWNSRDEAAALYRDGRLDWVPWGGGPGTLPPTGIRLVVSAGWGSVFLRLNTGVPRLGDAGYRRMLSEAVDRPSLVQDLRGPLLVPSSELVPQKTPYAPVKAARVFGPLPEPRLTILYAQGETYRLIASGVADAWKRKLGVTTETRAASYREVREAVEAGRYEAVVSSWLGDYPAPSTFLNLFAAPEEVPALPLLAFAAVNQIDLRRWTGWSTNPTDIHPWQGIGPKK